MGSHSRTLAQPIPKDNPYFPRSYPFPIIKDIEESGPFQVMIGEIRGQQVEVSNPESMNRLFTMGFFGKGSLSKCAPKALEDSLRKEFGMPKKKRRQRKKTNLSRSRDVKKDALKCEGDKETQEITVASDVGETEGLQLTQSEDAGEVAKCITKDKEIHIKKAEEIVVVSNAGVAEVLQLTFEEAYFLSYGLGCIVIKDKGKYLDLRRLWQRFCELHPAQNFPVMYTAYHHFRSKGWVVRSGVNYGTDYALYKDGPPFYHSSYLIIVKPVLEDFSDVPGDRPLTWSYISGLSRIVSHAAKELVILYVIKPSTMPDTAVSTHHCVSQYLLEEIFVRRGFQSQNLRKKRNI